MKKFYKLEGLDCPVCAAKVESAVKSLEGIKSASVNFITTKLTVEYDDSSADKILDDIKTAVKKSGLGVFIKNA